MENISVNNKENVIISVEPGSIADEIGIEPGDVLVSINGKEVLDVFDYRYLINDEYLEVILKDGNGEPYEAEIEKDYDEDLASYLRAALWTTPEAAATNAYSVSLTSSRRV